jgi:hypothetical protein
MRKMQALRGGGENMGVMSFEVAPLMSQAVGLWRALRDAELARLHSEAIRLEGVRRLVADDDAALLALALAKMAVALVEEEAHAGGRRGATARSGGADVSHRVGDEGEILSLEGMEKGFFCPWRKKRRATVDLLEKVSSPI